MKKYVIQLVVGIAISCLIAYYRMPQMKPGMAGKIMAFSDGFAVVGLLYFCFGALLFVSSTGFFDIFGYAFKKGANALFPKFGEDVGNYYDYKMEKQGKRESTSEKSTLLVGALILIIAGVLTFIWYQVA